MSELLTGNLPLIADAPDGIRTLRGLILELAVRGKLVPQDAGDEPARVLLERIVREKARMNLGRGGKRQQSTPPAATENQPFDLPEGWVWTRLAEIALINPRNAADDSTVVSFVPMAMIGSRFEGTHEQELRTWAEVKQGFTHFAEGDVGVAKITPCFENSKACVFSGLSNGIGAGTTELHIVRPIAGTLAPRYVLAYLKAPIFLHVGVSRMTGTAGQKRLPKDFLEQNPFPLPPLAEQHRIVAKVDELMALCDRLEAEQADTEVAHARLVDALLAALTRSTDAADFAANWQRLAAHFDTLFTTEAAIDALKQTVLQLATIGKLTANSHEGWETLPLDKICQAIVDCPHSTPKWTTSGKICVRTSQFSPGKLDLSTSRFVSESTFKERTARLKPVANDILYSREGGILGIACRIPEGAEICLGQRMMLIRSGDRIIPAFLEIVLNAPLIIGLARRCTTGGAAPRVNVSTIKSYPIPLPPLAEQHRIVAKVNELTTLCDRLKADLASARQRQATLADTLIAAALEAA